METNPPLPPETRAALLKDVAERIVRDLFTNGAGHEAARLVLTDRDGRNLGGWGRLPMQDRIESALLASLTAPEARGDGRVEPTERPMACAQGNDWFDPASRLLLNEYGRACWDAGQAALLASFPSPESATLRLALQALSHVSEVPCGNHAHAENQSGGLVYFCPWCEADVAQLDGEPAQPLQHAETCLRSRAVLALTAALSSPSPTQEPSA